MLQQENYAIPGMKCDVTKKAQDLASFSYVS